MCAEGSEMYCCKTASNVDWYGISIYWDKPASQRVYFPLGGGVQRQFNIGSRESAFSVQLFKNVLRPDKGAEHDFRLMFEVNF
jgi:hypothetical protein